MEAWKTKSKWLHWDLSPFHWVGGTMPPYTFTPYSFISENNGTPLEPGAHCRVQGWAPEYGRQNRFPHPEKELALSIEMGVLVQVQLFLFHENRTEHAALTWPISYLQNSCSAPEFCGAQVQGLLNLIDARTEDGGFLCVPGFHKHLAEWARPSPRPFRASLCNSFHSYRHSAEP